MVQIAKFPPKLLGQLGFKIRPLPNFFFLLFASFAVLSASAVSFSSHAIDNSQWPVFAAELSEATIQECQNRQCTLNALTHEDYAKALSAHPLSDEVFEALSLSEYELLISSAIKIDDEKISTLLLEMTTSWRGIPIDDYTQCVSVDKSIETSTESIINAWVEYVQSQNVFDAQRIYRVIGASDYMQQLTLPDKIGEFVFMETALYHDPLQGSISRYVHPQYADAVVDISVYPVSPFVHQQISSIAASDSPLASEMENEKSHIKSLIQKAKVEDYKISDIQPANIHSSKGDVSGLSLEVALQTTVDPIYSTQFLFTQNDKFIKLTGNLPKHMMLALVEQSIGEIRVPQESLFMQSMRQH
ncbi:hypothetical protein ACFO4O_17220 [Glaciecola siphonariae]|uniref:Uncharacterized protein n=1 Tax=Glaciecola siphonariae TaxID=521012 RepID=A0ABV9M0H1_9ALTE